MTNESALLDAIEDAREELKSVTTIVGLLTLGFFVSVGSAVAAGVLGSFGVLPGLVFVLGAIGFLGIPGFGACVICCVNDGVIPDAKKKLRLAERRHRNHLLND